MGRIVVGVDGSDSSKGALRWAVREARQTGADLQVVMTWQNPYADMWVPADPPGTDPMALIRRALDRTIDEVLGEHPAVAVQATALSGPRPRLLVEEAVGADLLVFGNRGHGGFAGVLLGSVSLHCVSHAPCPVVVGRGKATPAQQVRERRRTSERVP